MKLWATGGLHRPSVRRALAAAILSSALVGMPASAQTVTDAEQTQVAPGMSPLDVLLVQDAIRENWAEYTLLFDGDGVADRRSQWADRTFTKDLKWRWYDADGKLQMEADGVDDMRKEPQTFPQAPFKHLPIAIRFDSISPTEVKTRTIVVFLAVPKAKEKGGPDGVPVAANMPGVPQVGMAVYHDTWRRQADGRWLKSVSLLYSSSKGFWPGSFMPTKSHPTPGPG